MMPASVRRAAGRRSSEERHANQAFHAPARGHDASLISLRASVSTIAK